MFARRQSAHWSDLGMTIATRLGRAIGSLALGLGLCLGILAAPGNGAAEDTLPPAIRTIIAAPRYAGASWGLRVVDVQSGQVLQQLGPDALFFTGSVRKLFSVAAALGALGAEHRFTTPVYRRGAVAADGVLQGDLVLVASGDLTLGGRTTGDGEVAFTDFDHTEANSLGSAILTAPDPLAGIDMLARQVAASGIRRVQGEVIVDDRLFDHFRVPNGNVLITPVILNDNLVDVTIEPTVPGQPAKVEWRPRSAAFTVEPHVATVAAGGEKRIELTVNGAVGTVSGQIPAGYKPDLPGVPTLVQTFRIEDPSAYLRTAFIEALVRAGVAIDAAPVAPNPASRLPAPGSYEAGERVAALVSPPYAHYARLILKVSHNLGANLSLMLVGLSQGARTVGDALAAERRLLVRDYGLPETGFDFPTNGSGSPDSRATPQAIVGLLQAMRGRPAFDTYFAALPVLGVDGSLASIGRLPPDPAIAPAIGKVYAKTGTTFADGALKAQVFAGYIDARSGRRLAYVVYVNDATGIRDIAGVIQVFRDEGAISAVIRDKD
jgi:D-alanyl-D-alanine carboxypeptidase/D-alanyl-D-alanine-endopeptidase (penicillin-binding protein 4)